MNLVCALHQGPEEHYATGEQIAKDMFSPIDNAFRITIEQMAILESALTETTNTTLIVAMREAYNEVVRMGVPEKAARSFWTSKDRTCHCSRLFRFSDVGWREVHGGAGEEDNIQTRLDEEHHEPCQHPQERSRDHACHPEVGGHDEDWREHVRIHLVNRIRWPYSRCPNDAFAFIRKAVEMELRSFR